MKWSSQNRAHDWWGGIIVASRRNVLLLLVLVVVLILLQVIATVQSIEEDEKTPLQVAPVSLSPSPSPALSPQKQPQQEQVRLPSSSFPRTTTSLVTLVPPTQSSDADPPVEVVVHNNSGTIHGARFANSGHDGGPFITTVKQISYCHYEVHNFCLERGTLLFFHDPKRSSSKFKGGLRACNEFSRHSPSIYIKYWSSPLPDDATAVLPAPLNTVTKGWILQFWCQDLFHMTLSLLPAFHTKSAVEQQDADVYIRIAKGRRKKGGYCNVKLGDPLNFEKTQNPKYGQDSQFPFAGNPYWPFYRILTNRSEKIHPLVPGQSVQTACYQNGVIDKRYIKGMMGEEARNYSATLLELMGVPFSQPRPCGNKYRLTLIDRRGRTRRLTNIPELINLAQSMGFEAQSVAFETIPIREQIRLVTMTDVLIGVHGNGLMWLQFLPPGSVVIELVGVWYTPYALLWGHTYFHSKMRNNPEYQRRGEYYPFAHNVSEVQELLYQAKEALDRSRCGDSPFQPPNEQLANLYGSCVPHC